MKEIDKNYIGEVSKLSLSPEAIARSKRHQNNLFPDPWFGNYPRPGSIEENLVLKTLRSLKNSRNRTGIFPTVVYPNPEEAEAMTLAMDEAQRKSHADIIMATDPDADRVGIGVKNHHGEFQLLNGNQAGCLAHILPVEEMEGKRKLHR